MNWTAVTHLLFSYNPLTPGYVYGVRLHLKIRLIRDTFYELTLQPIFGYYNTSIIVMFTKS